MGRGAAGRGYFTDNKREDRCSVRDWRIERGALRMTDGLRGGKGKGAVKMEAGWRDL